MQNNDILNSNIFNEDVLNSFSFESDENTFENLNNSEEEVFENINKPLFLENLETIQENSISNFIEEIQEINQEEIIVEKKQNNFLSSIIFLLKYILTSWAIFAVLLLATNYNAYLEIAKSYINPKALETTKNGMYASINWASLITQANNEEDLVESINQEQKMDMVKNKTYHSMEKLVGFNKDLPIDISITPYENRVIIPKIWKNIPLIDVEQRTVKNVKELEDVFMKELVNWIVRYPWSAKPWQDWNTFIFWHSSNFPWLEWKYNDVFALLDNVVFGDEIIVYFDQKKYTYKISEKKIIKPGDTSVLKRETWKKEISLMTCWPVWTTLNRMIVIWELVEEK